jgi:hypothetical protein
VDRRGGPDHARAADGQLRNTLRAACRDGTPVATGLIPVGDARCHTNPTFAFGLSLSLTHAHAVAAAAETARGDADLVTTVERSVGPDAAERFEAVSAEDSDRVRLWSGEPIDPTDRTDTMPLFLRTVVPRVAGQDPAIFRALCRRINLLDPVDTLATNEELLDRAAKLYADLPPPDPAPPRATMLAALRNEEP